MCWFRLLLLSVLLRLPFFFRDVIDWDESTFTLMGQSVLDGHLPYTTIADVKLPLVFWGYGALMAILGNTIVAVRCAGMLIVWLIGVMTAWICPTLGMNRNQSAIAGALTILLLSFLWSGPATMTEHLAALPLVLALGLWIRGVSHGPNPHPKSLSQQCERDFESAAPASHVERRGWASKIPWLQHAKSIGLYGFFGVLMATASLIRGNLIYTAVALGLYLLVFQWQHGWATLQRLVAYGLGFMATIGATCLPYLWAGKWPLWWTYVVETPLQYSRARTAELLHDLRSIHPGLLVLGVLLGILLHGGIGMVMIRHWQAAENSSRRSAIAILGISFLATELSILRTGMGEFHYLLQLAPWFAISLVGLGQFLKLRSRYGVYILIGLCVISFNLPLRTLMQEYRIISDRVLTHQSILHGSAYEIADWFKSLPDPPQKPYMMVDQIVYHLLGVAQPNALVTHPSNITKPFLVAAMLGDRHTPEEELLQLLSQHPDFIVKTESLWYLPNESKLGQLLESALKSDYQLVKEIQGRQIFIHIGT
jgi:hypothetical protein